MAVSDSSGGVLYRFVYDTYGELSDIKTDDGISLKNSEIVSDKTKDHTVEELAHAAGFTYLYNGQYGVATDQNGLYYMRARYYDQDIKRFINRDIVSGDISNSKSLNRYAYVQGNPVSLTDPFGLCPDINSSARMVQTFLCDTDWSTVGHTALDIIGIFWDGADVINAIWYAAEGNTEMAIASAVYALPGIGMASGRLMMCSDKLYKAGKAVYRASKLTQGCYGVIGGLTMAGAGIGNIYNSLKNGEKISLKDILLAAGGTAIAVFSGKTTFSDMKQMLGISNKMDRTVKVGNADISHEPVPSEKKILEAAESGRAARSGNGLETELFLPDEYYQKLDNNIANAIAARDAEVARIQTLSSKQQSNVSTVVAGVDLRTGNVYVGVKNSKIYKDNATCAEDIVFRGLGGNTNANIIMTPAIRPRNNAVIAVCDRCQTKYPKNQFVKGTTFQ